MDLSKLSNMEVAALYYAMLGFRWPKTMVPSEKFKEIVKRVHKEVSEEYMDRVKQ